MDISAIINIGEITRRIKIKANLLVIYSITIFQLLVLNFNLMQPPAFLRWRIRISL